MKKIFVSLLAATMAVGMSVSAFAQMKSQYISYYDDNLYGETLVSGSTVYGDTWMQGGTPAAFIAASLTATVDGTADKDYQYGYDMDEINARLTGRIVGAKCEHRIRDGNGTTYRFTTNG